MSCRSDRESNNRFGLLWIAVMGAGVTVANLRHASFGEQADMWVTIGGWLSVALGAFAVFVILISTWAYGASRYLQSARFEAVTVRSGTMPALKSVLEEHDELRRELARTRPLGLLFVLAVNRAGIEIWHGKGSGSPTGALSVDHVRSVRPGKTSEGIWTYNAVIVTVLLEGEEVVLPFVVKRAGGLIGSGWREVAEISMTVQRLLLPARPNDQSSRESGGCQ